MQTIDLKIWFFSILFATFVHAALFMQSGSLSGLKSAEIKQVVQVTRLSFSQSQENVAEPEPQEKLQPEPVVETVKKPEKKSRRKKVIQDRKKTQQEVVKKKSKPFTKPAVSNVKQLVDMPPAIDSLWLKEQRETYLSHLLRHIEGYKFYPGAARRRGIVGKVAVSFKLMDDGGIGNLQITSRHRILKQAAAEALKLAMPMPLPAKGILSTRQINFDMLYAMQ